MLISQRLTRVLLTITSGVLVISCIVTSIMMVRFPGANTLEDHGDLKKIGNSTPRYLFGIDLNAAWKGFDVRCFFQGVMKREYWASTRYFLVLSNMVVGIRSAWMVCKTIIVTRTLGLLSMASRSQTRTLTCHVQPIAPRMSRFRQSICRMLLTFV